VALQAQQQQQLFVIRGNGLAKTALITGVTGQDAVAKIAGIKLCESLTRQFGRDYRSSGTDYTSAELAELIAEVTGFGGSIEFDRSKPDGTPRKLLDVSLVQSLGWSAGISLIEGLKDAYAWFLNHQADFRGR
jgi:hypothetical protein